jgi:hypothetical protein
MRDEHETTTEANRRITPTERDEPSEQLPEADDETTRGNVRMSRALDDDRKSQLRLSGIRRCNARPTSWRLRLCVKYEPTRAWLLVGVYRRLWMAVRCRRRHGFTPSTI